MSLFWEFLRSSKSIFATIGIALDPKDAKSNREKWLRRLKSAYFYFCAFNVGVLSIPLMALFIYEHLDDLVLTGPVWVNVIFVSMVCLKMLSTHLNMEDIRELLLSVRKVLEVSHARHHERFVSNRKFVTIAQRIYIAAIYGNHHLFFLMPICVNCVRMWMGSDHWPRVTQHTIYIAVDLESWPVYVVVYLWIDFLAFAACSFFLACDTLFESLALLISLEFDNLADDFSDFDWKTGNYEAIKVLVKRHCKLLTLVDKMNANFSASVMVTVMGSSMLLCFSLLQCFQQGEHIFSGRLGDIPNLMKFLTFFAAAVLQLFLMSVYCEKLRAAGEHLTRKIASGNWNECESSAMKRSLLVVLCRAQRPLELRAFEWFGVSMETFTNVFLSAYSYFNFLKSIN